MNCFPIIWSGSKLYVNRLGSSAITNKYKQEKKILDLLLLVHLLISFSTVDIAKGPYIKFCLFKYTFCLSPSDNHFRYCACSEGFLRYFLKSFKIFFLLFYSYWIGLFSSFERIIHWRTRCQRKRLIKTSRRAFKVL